jgi:hypothetical protein
MNLYLIYLCKMIVTTLFFYYGGVQAKAAHPELWSVVFGLVWPISVPLIIWFVIRAMQRD